MPQSGNKTTDNKDTVIRCRVTKDLDERLEKYCKKNNTTKSKVMTDGIEHIINKR